MPLVGVRYIQDADPGVPASGGYEWYMPTTDQLFIRNGANTAWTFVGYANQINLGNIPVSGGPTTGAITGATGLAPNAAPNFSTSAKRDGINLALLTDVNNLGATLRAEFQSIVTSGIAAATASSTTKANIGIKRGIFTSVASNSTVNLPVPQYPDLTTANWSDCYWVYGITAVGGEAFTNNFAYPCGCWITEAGTNPPTLTAHVNTPAGPAWVSIDYFVIAIR